MEAHGVPAFSVSELLLLLLFEFLEILLGVRADLNDRPSWDLPKTENKKLISLTFSAG